MTNKQPPLAVRPLEHNGICDICGKARSLRNHAKCSKIRQQRNAWKWVEDGAK